MGVIRDFSSYFADQPVTVEDAFENTDTESLAGSLASSVAGNEEPIRRIRNRHKPRAPVLPENSNKTTNFKCKGGKKYRRFENANQLMSLAEGEELHEVSIYDFIPETVSAFAQILLEKESMEYWNNFINCSDEDQWSIIENLEKQNGSEAETKAEKTDSRKAHPAFSAQECFMKIDCDLRNMLKKRHMPLGELAQLEVDILSYFMAHPQSVRRYHLPNSFQRLMVHALSQYMDLTSNSFDKDGVRWTKIQNQFNEFKIPSTTLTTFLEERANQRKTSKKL